MKLRCKNPECNEVIDFTQPQVRIGGRTYCSNDCCIAHAAAEKRLVRATDPFAQREHTHSEHRRERQQ